MIASTGSYSPPAVPAVDPDRGVDAILAAVVFGAQEFLNRSDWTDVLEPWLEQLGRATRSDQVRIFRNDQIEDGQPIRTSLNAEWKHPELQAGSPKEDLQHVAYADIGCSRWTTSLERGEPIVGVTADLPPCEQGMLLAQGIVSVAVVPVFLGARWWGFLGFADCTRPRHWSEPVMQALTAAAGIFGAALARREMEQRIGAALMQEQLATDIGEALTGSPRSLEESLHACATSIVRHLDADHVRIWAVHDEDRLSSTPAAGPATLDLAPGEIAVGDHAIGVIARDAVPQVWTNGVPELWPGSESACREASLIGGAAHPLITNGRVVGVVVMLLRRAPTQSQLEALASVTDELALAIEHARAQSALHLSEDRYRRLVDATVEGIVIHDGSRVVDLNPSLAAMIGYPVEEVIGRNPFDFLHPRCHADVRRRLAQNYSQPYEAEMIRRDGSVFPIEIKGNDYVTGGVKLRVVAIRDITAHKEAERATRRLIEEQTARATAERTRSQAEFLLDASHLLSSSFDTSTTLNQLAHLAVRALADFCVVSIYSNDDAQIAAVVHGDPTRQAVLERAVELWRVHWQHSHPFSTTQAAGEAFVMPSVTPHDLDRMARDPEHRHLLGELGTRSLMSAPIRSGGELVGSMMFASSRPDRSYATEDLALAQELGRRAAVAIQAARSYAEAQAATRAREEMLGVVAHDLRNPLNTISMGSSLALEIVDQYPGAPGRRQLEIIQRSASHMNRLIEDLLDASRVQTGQLALEVAPLRPQSLVDEALEMLEPLAAHAGIELQAEIAPDLSLIPGDRQRLMQVLSNLVGNALKFTPKGGRILLSVQRDEGAVRFSICDSGSGIPADQLPYIFGRFWQARSNDRRGLGLGLSIAKGIVEAHGGSIWVESTEGTGSTFAFRVPA